MVVNFEIKSIALYSKDAKFNLDFKNDNVLPQRVKAIEDISFFRVLPKANKLSLLKTAI